MRIAIIGTAGRGTDKEKMSLKLYQTMYEQTKRAIQDHFSPPARYRDGNLVNPGPHRHTLVSGGAAWADHVAVSLWLMGHHDLELHLPSGFDKEKNRFIGNRDAETANYYHDLFTQKMGGRDTRIAISEAIRAGVPVTYGEGFFDRNHRVADTQGVIAMTFGVGTAVERFDLGNDTGLYSAKAAGLKDGGTVHTWGASLATVKVHINLSLWV